MHLPDPWAFFDKIYCISVDVRLDRRAEAQRQFAAVGLLERVEFVIVATHPEDREKGIFESHMLCLKKGLAAGAKHILIFEDDIVFRHFDRRILAEACAALGRFPTWNALFLGCLTSGSQKLAGSLATIKYRCLAHAYALKAPFAERLVQQPWQGVPYDGVLRRCATDFFAIYPMSAFQGGAETDNQTMTIDRIRRFFGGLVLIQQMNEFYQNHKSLVVAMHLAIFLALILLVSVWR